MKSKVRSIIVLFSYLVMIESGGENPVSLIPCTNYENVFSSSPNWVYGRCVEKQHCIYKFSFPCHKDCFPNPTTDDFVCCNVNMIKNTVLNHFPNVEIPMRGIRNPGCKYFDSKDPSRICTDKGSPAFGAAGGKTTMEGEFPWMAAIFRISYFGNVRFQCGGSLIHPNFVLTSAHCLDTLNPIFYMVRIGAHNLLKPANNVTSKEVKVIQLYLHPNFSFPYNDIAILRIENTRNVILPCLPRKSFSIKESEFLSAIMIGWGVTELGGDGIKSPISEILQVIYIGTKPTIECISNFLTRSDFKSFFSLGIPSAKFICAGDVEPKINACHFHSGSPLFVRDTSSMFNQWVLIGVTSAGSAICGGDLPTLFTRLTSHLDWIMSIVGHYPKTNDPQRRYN